MTPIYILLIALYLIYTVLFYYFKKKKEPKVVERVQPHYATEVPTTVCPISEAFAKAWEMYEDTSTDNQAVLSHNGIYCYLFPDYDKRKPVMRVITSYDKNIHAVPETVKSHEDPDFPGISSIMYAFPYNKGGIEGLVRETLGVASEKDMISYYVIRIAYAPVYCKKQLSGSRQ